MEIALTLLLLGTLGGLGLAFLELQRTRALIANTHALLIEMEQKAPASDEWPADAGNPLAPDYEVVIRVDDPLYVAACEAPHSKLVSGIAPTLVRKEVYRQVVRESETLLAQRKIEAQVFTRLRAERRGS